MVIDYYNLHKLESHNKCQLYMAFAVMSKLSSLYSRIQHFYDNVYLQTKLLI